MTVLHTHPGVAERFIKDINELSAELLANPPKDSGGSVSNCVIFYGCNQCTQRGKDVKIIFLEV